MSDQDFFIELQGEFLTEAIFMLEQYEESMLGLESGIEPEKYLTNIFRVAHSIKGGASAVGFPDLGAFAHKVEDLLAILRVSPHFVNSDIISVLLESGDEFKKRLLALQEKSEVAWDPAQLLARVLSQTERLNGLTSSNTSNIQTAAEALPLDTPADRTASVLPLTVEDLEANGKLLEKTENPNTLENVLPLAATATVSTHPAQKTTGSGGNPSPKAVKASAITSIKVDLARLDSVLDAVGEIVVLKNQLIHDDAVQNGENVRLISVVDQLDKSVRELYEKTLGMRMTPLKSLFLKIQRLVRDVSLQLDKPLNLNLIGEETEVERTVFEILGDPMVHLIRNALDHGIESQAVRKERGKNMTASLTVIAKQSGGQVIIEIIDDGGGINRDKVLAKAIEKNILPPDTKASSMTNEQVYQLLFAPGFSTAEKLTDLSGRGVGLDVVKSNLERVHGKIEIESTPLKGSTFRLHIPLSTAITDGIVVGIRSQKFILPIHSIKELVRVVPESFTQVSIGQRVALVRDNLIPIADLTDLFGKLPIEIKAELAPADSSSATTKSRDESMLVIIETPLGLIGIPVDQVLGQTQAVVKPLQIGQDVAEISGAAVLGDGNTVLILDPIAIVMAYKPQHQIESATAA